MPESTGFSLNLQKIGDVALVSFRDNSILDVTTIQRIGRDLYDLVEKGDTKRVVLDFGVVRFLSSQALGVLLTLRRKSEKTGTEVVLSELRPELARVFKITNLDKMFLFFDSKAKALEHFGQKLPEEKKS